MFAGSDKKMYVANSLTKFDGPIVICPEGHINNTNGCIPCPPGTYLVKNKCEFCPLHHFQGREAQVMCHECAKNKGTSLRGSQHISNCKVMERVVMNSEDDPNLIYFVIAGGFIILLAIAFFAYFIWKRKKNNKIKKAKQEDLRLKRKQDLKLRQLQKSSMKRRSQRRSTNKRPVNFNNKSTNEQKKSLGQIEEPKTQISKGVKRIAPTVDDALAKTKEDVKKNVQNVPNEKIETISNVSDRTAATASDWNGSEAAESAIFTDYNSSDSASKLGSLPPKKQEKPLKSALKKPKSLKKKLQDVSDDEATVISATSLDRGQLQQLHKGAKSFTLDRNNPINMQRKQSVDDSSVGDLSRSSSIRSILKKDTRGERRNLNTLPARSASQRMTNPSHFQRIRPRGPMPHDLDYGSVYGSLRGPIPMVGGYVDDVYSPRGNHFDRNAPPYQRYWNPNMLPPEHLHSMQPRYRSLPRIRVPPPRYRQMGNRPQRFIPPRMRHPYY